MSIFASQTQKTIPIPFDAPHTATIHKLSGKDLDAAQYEHMAGVLSGRGRNWATRFIRLAKDGLATEADAQKILTDPLVGYDRLTMVQAGLISWTYQDGDRMKPVTLDAIHDLDDEALELFATAILRLTKPALFQTAAEQEQAVKND